MSRFANALITLADLAQNDPEAHAQAMALYQEKKAASKAKREAELAACDEAFRARIAASREADRIGREAVEAVQNAFRAKYPTSRALG